MLGFQGELEEAVLCWVSKVNWKKQFCVGFPRRTGRSSFVLGFQGELEEAVFCWVSNVNRKKQFSVGFPT